MIDEYKTIFECDYNVLKEDTRCDQQQEIELFGALTKEVVPTGCSCIDHRFAQFALKCNQFIRRKRSKIQVSFSKAENHGRVLLQVPLLLLSADLLQLFAEYAPHILIMGDEGVQINCYMALQ